MAEMTGNQLQTLYAVYYGKYDGVFCDIRTGFM